MMAAPSAAAGGGSSRHDAAADLVLSVTVLDVRGLASPAATPRHSALVVELGVAAATAPPPPPPRSARLAPLGTRQDFSRPGTALAGGAAVVVRARLLQHTAPPGGVLGGLASRLALLRHRASARGSAAVEEEIELGALEMRVSEGADSAPGAAARWVPLLGPATAGCQCELLVLATLAPRGRGAPTGEAAPDYPDASALLTMRVDALEGLRQRTRDKQGSVR